jgi:hypothetical protein
MVRSETEGPMYVLDVSAEPAEADNYTLPDVQILLESPHRTRMLSRRNV